MKKLLSMILVLCLVFSLVACTKPADKNPTEPTATDPTLQTAPTLATESADPTEAVATESVSPTAAPTEIVTAEAPEFATDPSNGETDVIASEVTEPTVEPTTMPTEETKLIGSTPTKKPITVVNPTTKPITVPTTAPTTTPTAAPATKPTAVPTLGCSTKPTADTKPTTAPTSPPTTAPTTAPTVPPSAPITYRQEGPFSKEGVPEFLAILHAKYPNTATSWYTREIDCYNDTPPEVAVETNIQFFSFSSTAKTLIMMQNEIYFLATTSFGPPMCERLINALPYDFDGDGIKDLLIAHCRETGGSYDNRISVFNPVSKDLTDLYIVDDGTHDYALYITASNAGGQISHTVSRVKLKYGFQKNGDDSELISKEYTVIDTAGYIEIKDGEPQFVTARPTTYPDKEYYTKENVPAFLELMRTTYPDVLNSLYYEEDKCYNVTPPDVTKETDMQIFQFTTIAGSFVLMDNTIYPLGGQVESAVICDFDGDKNEDLLFAHSYGSGIIFHEISVFNSVTKEVTSLHINDNMYNKQNFFVARHSADIEFVGKTDEDYNVFYPVLLTDNTQDYRQHTVIDIVGHIEAVDGKPKFIPHK